MDIPGKHNADGLTEDYGQFGEVREGAGSALIEYRPTSSYADDGPTSGMQQMWWLADSVPFGRVLVIGVAALLLVGAGYAVGKAGQKVVTKIVEVPVRQEPGQLLTALPPSTHGKGLVLDAELDNPQLVPQLPEANYVRFQPRLPWEEYPEVADPALQAVNTFNLQVTTQNRLSMEEYVHRATNRKTALHKVVQKQYYVTRRTPAYNQQARFGDKPSRFLMPGTPLTIDHTTAHWALVIGPAGESLWIKSAVLTPDKTHRST